MKKLVWVFIGIVTVAAIVFFILGFFKNTPQQPIEESDSLSESQSPPAPSEDPYQKENLWQEQGLAISGTFADAEIYLFDSTLRIFYSEEPENPGFSGKIFSATSLDGRTWTQEPGIRKDSATFNSIIKLPDGKYRMYFQQGGVIKSALSSDGLTWTNEPGTRIDTSNTAGLMLENVAAPTCMKIGNEYVLVYRGDINEQYPEKVPNENTQILMWATSSDGLTFTKKGIALDSRNPELMGLADGPEFVDFNGELRVYFWSYQGVYHTTFNENSFSPEKFGFTTNPDPNMKFYPNPAGDPTIINYKDTWFMYYGQHTKGIYYATLKK